LRTNDEAHRTRPEFHPLAQGRRFDSWRRRREKPNWNSGLLLGKVADSPLARRGCEPEHHRDFSIALPGKVQERPKK
jgi:hypothetical protein